MIPRRFKGTWRGEYGYLIPPVSINISDTLRKGSMRFYVTIETATGATDYFWKETQEKAIASLEENYILEEIIG